MASLRVTAGSLRSRRVPVPPGDLRPTSERARQAFFNIVGKRIDRAQFLDLFAGSGIFAFEAVSRGAASATAVDHDRRKIESIAKLANEWDAPVNAVRGEVMGTIKRLRERFDVIYADPPYDFDAYDALVEAIGTLSLAEDAVIAVEHRRRTDPFHERPAGLKPSRRAEYGEVWITFFEASGVGRQASGGGGSEA
ncbi:MAG TPA: 16S rRNA (guanine(966)-N(2))-methyltransferase RsmD [Thermoanaerobaculia bacterium]